LPGEARRRPGPAAGLRSAVVGPCPQAFTPISTAVSREGGQGPPQVPQPQMAQTHAWSGKGPALPRTAPLTPSMSGCRMQQGSGPNASRNSSPSCTNWAKP